MKNKKFKKNNKYSLLHKSNVKFAKKNLELLSENANLKDSLIKVENNLDDILQVKESLQLQNQTLEKKVANILDFLQYADGSNNLKQISNLINTSYQQAKNIYLLLKNKNLVK